MLRIIRIILAALCFTGITLLFLDFTGATHAFLGALAKIQLLPAILSANIVVIAAMLLLTLVFGRVYCSVICPLGVMQDIIAWAGKRGKKKNRFKYSYSRPKTWLRVTMLVIMVASIVFGISAVTALLAPYSAYGRIASSFFAPLYALVNNLFAAVAERAGSYAFYPTEVWGKATAVVVVAAVTLVALAILAWRNGRTYCNTICPVGTVLGFLSKFSLFRPVIDTSKCTGCKLCEKSCKAACIDISSHKIDRSRCVACMDCISTCTHGALKYKPVWAAKKAAESPATDASRRAFLATAGALTLAAAKARAQDNTLVKQVAPKNNPAPKVRLTPPGSQSHKNLENKCIGCQLCVQACPGNILVPSASLEHFMQPEMRYNENYCRPECNRCSSVCPTGAIRPISLEEKASTQIGHAVWYHWLCVPMVEGDSCGNCARHCPTGAITMVEDQSAEGKTVHVPAIDREKCIGCGACQSVCPTRPVSAIQVEGHEVHKVI